MDCSLDQYKKKDFALKKEPDHHTLKVYLLTRLTES